MLAQIPTSLPKDCESYKLTYICILSENKVVCCVGRIEIQIEIWKGPMPETLDYTIHIGSTPTFLYLDLLNNSVPTVHTYMVNVIQSDCLF